MTTPYHVGIDLGGTRIKALAVASDGAILSSENLPNGGSDAAVWISAITQLLDAWHTQRKATPESIGLCAPGLAAPTAECIAFMPGRMQPLEGLNWTTALQATVPVRVLNDAHAALLAETWRGAAYGARNAAMFTLGTGVGGALLSDGRLLRGAIGRAGHLGHISLNPDGAPGITLCPAPLEDAIGNHNLAARSKGRFQDTTELLQAVATGDADAQRLWLTSVRALGAAIVSVINIVDPEVIILGGGVSAADELLFTPLRDYLDAHEWRPGGHRVTLVPAELGDTAGALGAARYAMAFEQHH